MEHIEHKVIVEQMCVEQIEHPPVNAINIMDSLALVLICVFNGFNLMVEKLQSRGKSKWRMLDDIDNGS